MSASGRGDDMLGNYKIGKSIGQGTFGKVRLGTHILTDQKVAVKTLQKDKIVEQSDIERVTRQICILKILRHPNIIQLYEIIQTKTAIHLIMQYAEGGELYDYIVKNKKVQETEAASFMQQILSGVQYIHKIGIVHRDLKPQNLLLDANKKIKIVDFGLSNQYKYGQKLKTACGSPCYAAPEMIAGKRYECINVDIWSCGIIIYAMLCGYLPFEDPNTSVLYKKIIAGDFQMPKFLSSEARDILRNILNVNPETRFKIPQIRASQWLNLSKVKHQHDSKGIIVGKDEIIPSQLVMRKMQKYELDLNQARTYIMNNKHNHITATYYLLQKKLQKQQKKQNTDIEISKSKTKRQYSPLIYRPDKKQDYYIPTKKQNKESKNHQKNDSINASNIISSLVEANKNKLLTQRFNRKQQTTGNFQKTEDFKLFPKKISNTDYSNSSATNVNANNIHNTISIKNSFQLTQHEDKEKSFESKRNSFNGKEMVKIVNNNNHHGLNYSTQCQSTEPVNRQRQELSEQLKQISVKIDKQIIQLKKQNENMRLQSETIPSMENTCVNTNRKRTSDSFNVVSSRDKLKNSREYKDGVLSSSVENTSFNVNVRDRVMSQGSSSYPYHQLTPKSHIGPFNTKCLFMQNAQTLIRKISEFLRQQNVRFVEQQPFIIKTLDNHSIWIQSISGSSLLNLVNFTNNFPSNDQLLQILAQ